MRNINLNDFTAPVQLTIIATYAYLRGKQSQGKPLLPAEVTLLSGRLQDSPLCMMLGSNAENGYLQTAMNLEGNICLMAANLIARYGAGLQLDLNSLCQEMLPKIPLGAACSYSEIRTDGTMLILSRIDTGYGTVVKCYQYRIASFDEMLDILLSYDDELEAILENLKDYPDASSWMESLEEDLLNAYCYHIFGKDYESVYQNDVRKLPPMLLYQLGADIRENLRRIEEAFYL
ncbi:MAG: hypothetical protein IJ874_09850 [Ruminococcus sp.]|nr:hypothetical protein [Ruminococcus sp.]